MSNDEKTSMLDEILVTSRALVELEEQLGEPPSRLCEELRNRRRELLARLSQDRR